MALLLAAEEKCLVFVASRMRGIIPEGCGDTTQPVREGPDTLFRVRDAQVQRGLNTRSSSHGYSLAAVGLRRGAGWPHGPQAQRWPAAGLRDTAVTALSNRVLEMLQR